MTMEPDRWSSTSSDEARPIYTNVPAPLPTAEEIQVLMLGAPRSGKTRMHARYTLRQFVDMHPDSTGLVGGHKLVHLLNGNEAHLIIHEFPCHPSRRTGQVSGQYDLKEPIGDMKYGDEYISVPTEDHHRKRLLQRSDAVMMVFNPCDRESFEWINNSVIEEILYSGRKKQLTHDIVRLLDGLAASIPERSKSTRTNRSMPKKLTKRPDSQESLSDESLFSGVGEEKDIEKDRIDYAGELKRISIAVEGAAYKKAEFMIHEKDLPPPPCVSPTPSPLAVPSVNGSKKLPTICEFEVEDARKARRTALMNDEKILPIMKHDSMISYMSASSIYSQGSSTVVDTRQDPNSPTAFLSGVPLNPPTFGNMSTIDEALESTQCSPPPRDEETEVPVLLVAAMSDLLEDNGGKAPRQVTQEEALTLTAKFGANCEYVELSSKTNTNVDEAYEILVQQVMTKRDRKRRQEMQARWRDLAIAREEKQQKQKQRTCGVPQWAWLQSISSAMSSVVSSAVSRSLPAQPVGSSAPGSIKEDVWGELVEPKLPRRNYMMAQTRKELPRAPVEPRHSMSGRRESFSNRAEVIAELPASEVRSSTGMPSMDPVRRVSTNNIKQPTTVIEHTQPVIEETHYMTDNVIKPSMVVVTELPAQPEEALVRRPTRNESIWASLSRQNSKTKMLTHEDSKTSLKSIKGETLSGRSSRQSLRSRKSEIFTTLSHKSNEKGRDKTKRATTELVLDLSNSSSIDSRKARKPDHYYADQPSTPRHLKIAEQLREKRRPVSEKPPSIPPLRFSTNFEAILATDGFAMRHSSVKVPMSVTVKEVEPAVPYNRGNAGSKTYVRRTISVKRPPPAQKFRRMPNGRPLTAWI